MIDVIRGGTAGRLAALTVGGEDPLERRRIAQPLRNVVCMPLQPRHRAQSARWRPLHVAAGCSALSLDGRGHDHDHDHDPFVGSQLDSPDSPDVAVTIFGTDVQRLSDVLDRIATQERDRFTVIASEYSLSELEQSVTDADARLADAGIEATAWAGMGHIDVFVVTPDGQPDRELERATRAILGDLPFDIEFTSPPVSLDS